ncbi:MAG: purine-nucleoside phosphorylase [Clostridia bacterium]|nr:purine-nucleoside phosphorylase [Clostridia bacterium]
MSAANTPTPHNAAKYGEIAKTVLMPGDPLRAKFVAENFLTDVKQFNGIRNMFGFTGKYNGKEVSVMGSGMGMPSIGIYSYELFNFYDVENIIRIGTTGAIHDDLDLGDLVIAQGSCTDSNYAAHFELPGTFAPIASYKLLRGAVDAAEKLGIKYMVGNVLSSDVFYTSSFDGFMKWKSMGVLCAEMESAALYMNAAQAGKNALCILTVSDCPMKGLETTAEERQNSFTNMMKVALSLA